MNSAPEKVRKILDATSAGAAEPASPCIGACQVDAASGCCQGCRRTLTEIAGWRDYSDAEKWAVLARLGIPQVNPEEDS